MELLEENTGKKSPWHSLGSEFLENTIKNIQVGLHQTKRFLHRKINQ